MKRKMSFVALVALLAMAFVSGCATTDNFFKSEEEVVATETTDQITARKAAVEAKGYKAFDTGPMVVINPWPQPPKVNYFPGDEANPCVAVKGYRWGYASRALKKNQIRLEICFYGIPPEKQNSKAIAEWLNSEQKLVNPDKIKEFFENFDPNRAVWDDNGNGDYTKWCGDAGAFKLIGWDEKSGWAETSGIIEEDLPDEEGQKKLVMTEKALLFDIGKWDIKPQYRPICEEVFRRLEKSSGPIVVSGHTDNTLYKKGSSMNNQILSEKRARAVADFLIGRGINSTRISVAGFGATRPAAGTELSQTEADREKNRRVEIIFSDRPE